MMVVLEGRDLRPNKPMKLPVAFGSRSLSAGRSRRPQV